MISIVKNLIGNIWKTLFGTKSFLSSIFYGLAHKLLVGSKSSLRILIAGSDNEGKEIFYYRSFQRIYAKPLPATLSWDKLTLYYEGYRLYFVRVLRKECLQDYADSSFDGVVFVVAAADDERFSEAKAYLKNIERVLGYDVPLLILGNKIDLDGAVGGLKLANQLGLPSSVDLAVRDAVLAILIINKRKEGFGLGRIPRDIAFIIAKIVFATSGDFELWERAGLFIEKKRNLDDGSVKILKKNVALQMCSLVKDIGYWEGFQRILKSAIDGF